MSTASPLARGGLSIDVVGSTKTLSQAAPLTITLKQYGTVRDRTRLRVGLP